MEKFHGLGLEFGDSIAVTGNGFSAQQGFFIAFQNDFLIWATTIAGVTRLVSTSLDGLTIVRL
ncbi:MAG: hypothetical protein GX072_11395 [Lysinibacillus sp.]|nr:hypothetical protein [Lysinibacillus sp.]